MLSGILRSDIEGCYRTPKACFRRAGCGCSSRCAASAKAWHPRLLIFPTSIARLLPLLLNRIQVVKPAQIDTAVSDGGRGGEHVLQIIGRQEFEFGAGFDD